MQLTEDQAVEVKNWVVKKLEDISDADSDVLADYVLALIRSDAPDEEIRKASVENLEDFLREHTSEFVEELFATFAAKQPPSAPAQPQATQGAPFAQQPAQAIPPTGPMNGPYGAQPHGDNSNVSRKRTYDDGFSEEQGQEGAPHHRQIKNPRRGRGGRGDWMGRGGHQGSGHGQFSNPSAPGFPVMPPGFPGFDQNDPMAAMMAMQSMGFPQMPGMPPMPMPPGGQQPDQMAKSSEKCPFYETQGICYLGAACPYSHDTVPGASKDDDEYDPKSSNIVSDFRRGPDGPMRGNDRGRGRGRGRGGDRGGFNNRGRRSDFSSAGPNDDPNAKTIVVEQIPDDKLDDFTVRDFFSQYGEIADISLQPHKKLALITYNDHATAKAAWSSPKVIFDNRFVKVYWHKPRGERNNDARNGSREEALAFDPEEFQRQQEEAQKVYEEKAKQRQETEKAKQNLEKQREELLKKQEEEKQRLLQRIGGATGTSSGSATPDGTGATQSPSDENASEQTKQLRAQLAALEAEAKSLGLDPNANSTSFRGRGRGRGGFAPRGRGYDPSYRGSYRGRGGFNPRGGGRGGVLRLDNRPKRVAVTGIKPNSEQDEAFRQFLIGVGEYESITPTPAPNANEEDSLVVAFKERYVAEKFMFGPRNIPSVGEVSLSWVPNPPISLPASGPTPSQPAVSTPGVGAVDEDVSMSVDSGAVDQNGGLGGRAEVDYDVAEVDDSW
ncbi:CCCH zinc finger and RRM domain protein [Aspergillus stella-maris]|uniref:CCCH zinc finger and RRM domain protein n=1 Tax=Aspergillus stella-maris TaxID=1810926 RepID=UPI003CCCA26F